MRRASGAATTSQTEADLQGVCHELLEVIEGQEYIIEDGQFGLAYALRAFLPTKPLEVREENKFADMNRKMMEVKAIAEDLYQNIFNCRRVRERAGLTSER